MVMAVKKAMTTMMRVIAKKEKESFERLPAVVVCKIVSLVEEEPNLWKPPFLMGPAAACLLPD